MAARGLRDEPLLRRLLLVFGGGSVGATARFVITLPSPAPYGAMLATLAINVAGALALGVLVEVLQRRVRDPGRRLELRLLLRTGLLGGFTTYSALGLYTAELLRDGLVLAAVAYAGATLLAGAAATYAGGRVAAGLLRDRGPGRPGAAT